ncbi:MAG: hypothetical protein HY290_16015 [Planctomycetia bacterium]|nr:hypothetical protein [Planctomycetia bacterium]
MGFEFMLARRYLAPHAGTFWEWQDGGQVVAWRDGGSIAFRAEIERVLDRLAPHGLPPMDAVVMFLAACRSGQRADGRELIAADVLPASWIAGQEDQLYADVVSTLDSIAALPSGVRDTPARKAELAALVFEAAQAVETPEAAAAIVGELRRGFGAEMLVDRHDDYVPELLFRLAPLAAGAGRIDAARVALRQSTGMEQLPVAAGTELPEPDSFSALLNSLEHDAELGGMIRLARQLMAALTLPRAVSEHDDLPLGGVSDITNRGALDRLLVSELAHDDLTFTVRVALNEALYLRREAPPNVPPRRRMVLIDSGLRMWGLPRVFAASTALALAGTRRSRDELAVYRPRESNLDHVDLLTRSGLVAHLAALEAAAHPGAALPTFERLAQEDEPASEAVLITGEDVLADKAFRQALDAVEQPLYVISVNRSGRLRLSRRSKQGTKLLREARYDLEKILAPTPRVTPFVDKLRDVSLPAILGLPRFPLLLSHAFDPQSAWGEPGKDVLCLTHDQRLMHWSDSRFAGRQLTDSIPPGRMHWHEFRPGQPVSHAVIGRLSQRGLSLVRVDLGDRTCAVLSLLLNHHKPCAVAAHAGALFAIFREHVEVFSLSGGEPVQTLSLPSAVGWHRDRFFYDPQNWYALSFDGSTAILEKICDRTPDEPQDRLICLFDSEYTEGPVGITRSGEFRCFGDVTGTSGRRDKPPKQSPFTQRMLPPIAAYSFGAISGDGRRVVLNRGHSDSRGNRESWLIDLHHGEVTRTNTEAQSLLTGSLLAGLTRMNFRSRFRGICFSGKTLILISEKGERLGIAHYADSPDGPMMQWIRQPAPANREETRFLGAASRPGAGYRLSKAEWNEGSAAWLDSRGLLHLKSGDSSIPEVTLVLGDNAISGWCSDGRVWGPEYFTGDVPRTDPRQIDEEVLRPLISRLR